MSLTVGSGLPRLDKDFKRGLQEKPAVADDIAEAQSS